MGISHGAALLVIGSLAAIACSFDSDGLASSGNTAGSVESGGSGSSAEDGGTPGTTVGMTSTPTGSGTQTTSATGPSTTMDPTTTSVGTETGVDDTSATDPDSSAGTTTNDPSQGTSSDGGPGSSESGAAVEPYGMCAGDEDCGGGTCVTLYIDFDPSFHVCYPPCEMTRDCPAPDGGAATPLCTTSGCGLDCEGDVACPAGMECGWTAESNRRCVWP